jgi:hypothetical protein
MYRFANKNLFNFCSDKNLLKNFGITNATIVRNLRFFVVYLALLPIMKVELDFYLPIQTQSKIQFLIQALLSPFRGPRQGDPRLLSQ